MNFGSAAILLSLLAALAMAVWGLFTKQKSAVVALTAILLAIIAAGCGWYAWAEVKSMPWTGGYAVAAVCLASAIRQFTGNKSAEE